MRGSIPTNSLSLEGESQGEGGIPNDSLSLEGESQGEGEHPQLIPSPLRERVRVRVGIPTDSLSLEGEGEGEYPPEGEGENLSRINARCTKSWF